MRAREREREQRLRPTFRGACIAAVMCAWYNITFDALQSAPAGCMHARLSVWPTLYVPTNGTFGPKCLSAHQQGG